MDNFYQPGIYIIVEGRAGRRAGVVNRGRKVVLGMGDKYHLGVGAGCVSCLKSRRARCTAPYIISKANSEPLFPSKACWSYSLVELQSYIRPPPGCCRLW
jgi:hypothetical protein